MFYSSLVLYHTLGLTHRLQGNYAAHALECEVSEVILKEDCERTIWKLIWPLPPEGQVVGDVHGVYIRHSPFKLLKKLCDDDEVKGIIDRLLTLSQDWLDYDASNPVDVDSHFCQVRGYPLMTGHIHLYMPYVFRKIYQIYPNS